MAGKSLRQTGLTRTTDALEDMQLTHSQSAEQQANIFKGIKQLNLLFRRSNTMLELFSKLFESRHGLVLHACSIFLSESISDMAGKGV